MATKGTAAKSASGASMSKYDVEVEGRLTSIEKKLVELQANIEALQASDKAQQEVDVRFIEIEKKINTLWN